MFKFPENLYTDVRIEDVFETKIVFTLGSLDESKIRKYRAAFVRVFDGDKWYYASTSDEDDIQNEIDKLSSMATPNKNIYDNQIVKNFQINSGKYLSFEDTSVAKVNKEDKINLLKSFFSIVTSVNTIKMWTASYVDSRKISEFY